MSLLSWWYHHLTYNYDHHKQIKNNFNSPQVTFHVFCTINNFRTLIPALRLRPLNLLSASSVNLHGLANTSIFHNNLRVMLSPLKPPVLRKYSNPFKRPGMYPSISKCNAKRCNCCMHLCTNSTVTSSVNGRKFSVVNNSDLDWKSIDLIYVLT